MVAKFLLSCLFALLVVAVVAGPVLANPLMHEGTVVSAGGGKLTMKDKAGKEHSHTIDSGTKITVHGKPGRLEDLKLGMAIRVTTEGAMVLAVSTVDDVK